jgi:hypothetical protein
MTVWSIMHMPFFEATMKGKGRTLESVNIGYEEIVEIILPKIINELENEGLINPEGGLFKLVAKKAIASEALSKDELLNFLCMLTKVDY